MSPLGKAKPLDSLPRQILSQDEHEYGVSSYHRGKISDMKNALNSNDGIRD